MRRLRCLVVAAVLGVVGDGSTANGWGSYGNGGSGPGFVGVPVSAQHCGDGWFSQGGVCGPWWSGGPNTVCGPGAGPGFWFGFPGFGFGGCYGSTRSRGADSVFLAVPNGGTATFFSGRLVPFVSPYEWSGYPAYGYPAFVYPAVGYPAWVYPMSGPVIAPRRAVYVPRYRPRMSRPLLGDNAPAAAGGMLADDGEAVVAVRQSVAPRPSNAAARSRALKFVAAGDRHLREADGAVARLEAALGSYRRAGTVVEDDPDIHVRQALALVALGRLEQAERALDRAVAIDGRLGVAPAPRDAGPPDPVFGDRPAGAMPALAERGAAILGTISAQTGGAPAAAEPLAWLARRWSERWPDALGAVAANGAAAR